MSMSQSAAIARLNSRALVRVEGADWRVFLQGLISQDVETLNQGEVRFGALLNPQGRLLFDLFLVGGGEGCLIDVAADRREALIQRLNLYRLRAKVRIAADDGAVLALWPKAAAAPGPGWSPDPRLAELGWRGYGAVAPVDAEGVDEAAYDAWRGGLGVPDSARDSPFETDYPIEANFDLLGGIDFRKGCFVGQETTSRMKRRGTVKSRMAPIAFDGAAPAPGSALLAGGLRAGQVLSGADDAAMALLRLDRLAEGEMTLEDGRPWRVTPPAWMDGVFGA